MKEKKNLIDRTDRAHLIAEMLSRMEKWFIRYVDTQRDGSREGVTGKGQIGLAGSPGRGKKAFYDGE